MNDRDFMRYSRQLLLEDIAIDGQQRLLASRVLIVGLGGLGSPAALYLVGAGVGTLALADDDSVHISNLQRQILFTVDDLDHPKAERAAKRLAQLNPDIRLLALRQRLSGDALRQQVATVFQDPDQQIFYTDIDSDIAFALRNLGVDEAEIARRVDDALTLVDAQHFRPLPIQCLSHGQKKRIAIAGALVLKAKYLLLDEPTAGLDPSGRSQMIAIIKRIVAQGNHVVISSHDIDLIYEVSDAVYVLRQGEVLASGSPGEVFARRTLMEEAGLCQPWLVKLHTECGFPLCKTEEEFFNQAGATAPQEAL